MFGEISLLVMLQAAALIAAGLAAGYFLALQRFDKQRDKLRDELESTREELKEHREQVDNHFLKTGLLFNRLTDNYREIYEHLATGAQNLCSPQMDKPQLNQPESRVLPASGTSTPADEEDSELSATHSPHPDVESSLAAQVGESPADRIKEQHAESADAEPVQVASDQAPIDSPEETVTPEDNQKAKPAAETVPSHDEKIADSEHLGADAAPAPTLAPEATPSDLAPTTETPPPLDQHKSPPSIH